MATPADSLADPRVYPDAAGAPEEARRWFALAGTALDAPTADRADALNGDLRTLLRAALERDASALSAALAAAPSAPLARHLWRQLELVWRERVSAEGGVAADLFAIPVVI